MTMPEVIAYLEGYARASDAPVVTDATVYGLRRTPGGYRVATSRGACQARIAILATGQCDVPLVPAMARGLPVGFFQLTPSSYRNPKALPAGGVLIVGASASGVQLAEEIHLSGRPVTLAVGRHTRLPRAYRGRDILDWMDRIGVLGETAENVRDLVRARRQPSLQLIGSPDRRNLDLPLLQELGVCLIGRVLGIRDGMLHAADDLVETTAAAQATLERMLARIDRVADVQGAPRQAWPAPFHPARSRPRLDLGAEGIRTVIWATGFARNYSWLQVPVLDADGEIRHAGGVTPSPGLYALGLRFMRTRRSTFLDGVGPDAEALAEHIQAHLAHPARAAA